LSWEGDEPSTAAVEEASAPAAEESAPLPQAETVAPAVEAALPEASIVEGEYTAEMQPSSSSSRSPRETDPMCLLLTGAEVEGSTMLTDKTRIHLRSASVRTYTFFTRGFPRFLSICGASGLLALN
jgi:hypothetical protein